MTEDITDITSVDESTDEPLGTLLSPRYNAFIDAYLDSGAPTFGNATQSAIVAGFTDGPGIRVTGHRVLTNSNVQREITQRINAAKVTEEYVRNGLVQAAEGALQDHAYGAATAAFRELGRILAMFTDRTELDIRAQVLTLSAELGLPPEELEAEVKRLSEGK